MPLNESGSKEALHQNIATEVKAGKSPEQAAAIAYSVQKANDCVEYVQPPCTLPDSINQNTVQAKSLTYGNY